MKGSGVQAGVLAALIGLGSPLPAGAQPLDEVRSLIREGRHDTALARLETRLAASPADPSALFLKGLALAESGRREAAIETFSALTREYPELPEPHNNLAVLYAASGELEKARASLLDALRVHPNYPTAHENLGELYRKMASLAYSKALDLDGASRSPSAEASAAPGPAGSVAAGTGAAGGAPSAADSLIEAHVLTAVADWLEAWSRQDVETYLNHYSDAFVPADGRSRQSWTLLRQKRVSTPQFIELEIARADVDVTSENRASVTFVQRYRSDTYADQVTKRLDFVKQGQRWKIVSERTVE